ncbi:tetratricopeptide repeat protein [Dactylosporangium sp. NPDC051484]|uniref:fibronectin type III domain-containing protein n=1 Tax=Dactylosporangium sp. NPDC051484 TaxID=3154942 RepID=UPI00344D41C6
MSSSAQLANAVQGARAIAAQGDKRGALTLLSRALAAAASTLGPDDPDVLATMGQLARHHVELGDLGDARRVLEEALAAGHHRLGDGHAVMLGLSYELARIADELGNVFEAKRRYGQLARLGPQALGDGHPSVRAARRYLGLPEPAGAVHVPQRPPPTFDPVTPPPSHATVPPAPPLPPPPPQPVSAPPADERPVSQPEAWDVDRPAMSPRTVQASGYAAQAGDPEDPDELDELDEDDYHPAPWQRVAPGVLRRPGHEPMSGPSWQAAPVPTAAATAPPLPSDGSPRRRRSPLVAILVIVVVAVLGGGIATAVTYFAASRDETAAPPSTGPPSSVPPSAAPGAGPAGNPRAPGGLKLRDDKSSVTLTWKDPSGGSVPFVVAGGAQGAMRELQGLPAGSTQVTINGLNPKLEYCFTVAAVYGTQDVQLSDLACTSRK